MDFMNSRGSRDDGLGTRAGSFLETTHHLEVDVKWSSKSTAISRSLKSAIVLEPKKAVSLENRLRSLVR
jgi:hypothetical protein